MDLDNFEVQLETLGFLTMTLNRIVPKDKRFTLHSNTVIFHDVGVIEVIPPEWFQCIVLSSGIHGDETAPIELLDQLLSDIVEARLFVKARLLFIIGHPDAIDAHQRFIDVNLNRLFNDEVGHTQEHQIANNLKRSVSKFFCSDAEKWHLDLHSAIRDSQYYAFAVLPFTELKLNNSALHHWLEIARVGAALESNQPSSTFSWYSAYQHQAMAMTLELGRVAKFGENDHHLILPIKEALSALISGKLRENSTIAPVKRYTVSRVLVKTHESFKFNFPPMTPNFTSFEQGDVIGQENGHAIIAAKGESVIFPNENVAIGQRAALMVVENDYFD